VIIEKMGGAVAAVESGYMKGELVKSNSARIKAIEDGRETVVGVNAYETTEPSPLSAGDGGSSLPFPSTSSRTRSGNCRRGASSATATPSKAALED
jgi:(2R)-ethylmalonyl-CoA mutase